MFVCCICREVVWVRFALDPFVVWLNLLLSFQTYTVKTNSTEVTCSWLPVNELGLVHLNCTICKNTLTQNTCKTNDSRPLVNEPKQLRLMRRTAEKDEDSVNINTWKYILMPAVTTQMLRRKNMNYKKIQEKAIERGKITWINKQIFFTAWPLQSIEFITLIQTTSLKLS